MTDCRDVSFPVPFPLSPFGFRRMKHNCTNRWIMSLATFENHIIHPHSPFSNMYAPKYVPSEGGFIWRTSPLRVTTTGKGRENITCKQKIWHTNTHFDVKQTDFIDVCPRKVCTPRHSRPSLMRETFQTDSSPNVGGEEPLNAEHINIFLTALVLRIKCFW